MKLGLSSLLIVSFSALMSCQKTVEMPLGQENDARNLRQFSSKSGLSYGETIFYLSNKKNENVISPISTKGENGKFVSIPSGLALDAKTGAFDISLSDPGQAYKIFFVNDEGKLKDSARIVISGVDYQDGIYSLRRGNSKISAKYNANSNLQFPSVFTNSFESGNNKRGNGNKKLSVNSRSGHLDIESSVKSGVLEMSKRGEKAANSFELYYQLSDKSRRAKNKLQLEIYYYNAESDISVDLRNQIKEREEILKRVNAMPLGNTSGTIGEEGKESDLDAFAKPVRPPLIIIISQ